MVEVAEDNVSKIMRKYSALVDTNTQALKDLLQDAVEAAYADDQKKVVALIDEEVAKWTPGSNASSALLSLRKGVARGEHHRDK